MEKALLALLLIAVVPVVFAGSQTVGTVSISPSPIDLAAGSTKLVTCNATVTDTDNWNNITTVNATIWHYIDSTEAAADNNTMHYTNTSCTLGTNTSLTARPANCGFNLQYYSNNGTWSCKIRSYNSTGEEASNSTNATINQLVSLDVTEATLDFGTLALGGASADDINATVQNTGNAGIDVQLSGTTLSCNSGSVLVGNMTYFAVPGTAYGSMTALTGSAATLDLNVSKSTGSSVTKLTHWKVQLPATGVGGTCTNTVTFTAVVG